MRKLFSDKFEMKLIACKCEAKSGPEIAHETTNGCNFGQFPSFGKLPHVFARIMYFLCMFWIKSLVLVWFTANYS